MKRNRIDLALVFLCGLLALAMVLVSATGSEKTTVVLFAIVLGLVISIVVVGRLLIGCRQRTQVLQAFVAPILAVGIIASVAATHWPLRISYSLSRNSFDSIAQRVRAGEQVKAQRVGLVSIRRTEVYHNGIVCLWTALNPGGNTGFVQCGSDHVPFNLWSMVRLDGHWQFISED